MLVDQRRTAPVEISAGRIVDVEDQHMHRKYRGPGMLAVAVSTLLVSACGVGDEDGGGDGGGSDGSRPTVMVIGDITSTIPFTVPEIIPTVEGALRDVDVEVLSCDAQGDANAAQACARRAVDEGAVAVISGFSQLSLDQSVLEAAGIPVIGFGSETSPVSYLTSSSFAQYVALGAGLGREGCENLGIIYLSGSDSLVDNIKNGFESTGGREVARADVAANAPDVTPAIAKLTDAGAECVALSLPPTGVAQAITAIEQSGEDLLMGTISATVPQELLDALGDLTEGLIVVGDHVSQYDPQAEVVRADMDAAGGQDEEVTPVGILTWTAAQVLAAALEQVDGEVTAESLTEALDGLEDVDMQGVIPPFSTQEFDNAAFARVMNPYGISYRIEGGTPVRQGDFYDLTPVLNA